MTDGDRNHELPKNLPWKVSDDGDYGLVIEDSDGCVVAFFGYPDDLDNHPTDAPANAAAICAAVNMLPYLPLGRGVPDA